MKPLRSWMMLLAAVVLFAGCSDDFSNLTPEPTPSPEPTPYTENEGSPTEPVSLQKNVDRPSKVGPTADALKRFSFYTFDATTLGNYEIMVSQLEPPSTELEFIVFCYEGFSTVHTDFSGAGSTGGTLANTISAPLYLRIENTSVEKATFTLRINSPGLLAAPANLTNSDTTYTGYRLQWDSVPNASGYEVYRSPTQTGTYTRIAQPSVTYHVVSGLSPDQMYWYKVNAVNVNEAGLQTEPYLVATYSILAPANFTASSITSSGMLLSWSAVEGADSYQVDRYNTASTSWVGVGTPTATSQSVSSLDPGISYTFRVRAVVGSFYGIYANLTQATSN